MRSRHTMVGGTAAAILLLAVALILAACGGTTTTTEPATTTATAPTTTTIIGPVLKIDETANGTTVKVPPAYTVILVLKGNPSTGSTWNLTPPNQKVLKNLPGSPVIVADSTLMGADARYEFEFTSIEVGQTTLNAEYVSPEGDVVTTFTCKVDVVSDQPTTTTTAKPATTTTGTGPTTTTAKPTTTTAKPTTTTAKPTTTTVKPTTTTVKPTTTTTHPKPTTTTLPKTTYIDLKDDGKIIHLPLDYQLVLTLETNPSTGYEWVLQPLDPGVLEMVGQPKYMPFPDKPGSGGFMIWTFKPAATAGGALATKIELKHIRSSDGDVGNNFFVGVVLEGE